MERKFRRRVEATQGHGYDMQLTLESRSHDGFRNLVRSDGKGARAGESGLLAIGLFDREPVGARRYSVFASWVAGGTRPRILIR